MHNQAFFRSPTQLFTRPHITRPSHYNSHRNITMTLSLKQWSCVLCGERMKLEVFKSCVLSGFFAPCKEIQDSFGVLIPRRGFRIPVTGFQALKHGFWFSIVSGIPDSLSYIPDIKAQDFGYHKYNFSRIPESTSNKFRGFRNPDSLHVASFVNSQICTRLVPINHEMYSCSCAFYSTRERKKLRVPVMNDPWFICMPVWCLLLIRCTGVKFSQVYSLTFSICSLIPYFLLYRVYVLNFGV